MLASKIAVYGKVIITLTQQNILKSHLLDDEPVPYYTCYVKALKGESVCVRERDHTHAMHRMNSQVTSHVVEGCPVSFHAGGAPCI